MNDRLIGTHYTTMSNETTDPRGRPEQEARGVTDPRTGLKSTVVDRSRDGTIPILLGGIVFASAVQRLLRGKGGVALRSLLGAGLLAFGIRQQRVGNRAPESTAQSPDTESREQSTGGDSIEYVKGADDESHPKPHLDTDQSDPRYDDRNETTKVDLNDVTMADEESEAAQPTDEHAQPAMTDETEPEDSPPEDASHMQADQPDDDADEGEAQTDEGDEENQAGEASETDDADQADEAERAED